MIRSIFKVIVGTSGIIEELVMEVEKQFLYWNSNSEDSLKRFILLYYVGKCGNLFENYEDAVRKIETCKAIKIAQVTAWSDQVLAVENIKQLDHQSVLTDIFQNGKVVVNKALKAIRDEGKSRIFTAFEDPVVMKTYIGQLLRANRGG